MEFLQVICVTVWQCDLWQSSTDGRKISSERYWVSDTHVQLHAIDRTMHHRLSIERVEQRVVHKELDTVVLIRHAVVVEAAQYHAVLVVVVVEVGDDQFRVHCRIEETDDEEQKRSPHCEFWQLSMVEKEFGSLGFGTEA